MQANHKYRDMNWVLICQISLGSTFAASPKKITIHCIVCIVCSAQYALTIRMAPRVHHFSNLKHLDALCRYIYLWQAVQKMQTQRNFEQKALEVWVWSFTPSYWGFSFTKRLFITDLVVKESPIEFMALDWPERQLSAEVESSSSFQSRDSWQRCRKVGASEHMGIYELAHGRKTSLQASKLRLLETMTAWVTGVKCRASSVTQIGLTVVEKTPHPINLASLPKGSGKIAKSEPANWNILIVNRFSDHQNHNYTFML